jgi:hypothetical protein
MATLRQIQETLSQTSGAQFLYQPIIDRALFEATRKFTSTRTLFPRRTWNTPTYIFNKRTNYPVTQSTVEAPPTTGTGSVAATSSTYTQISYPVKHWQANMDLAKFSIQTARVNGDLMELELQGASESAMWYEEALNFYGSAGATANMWRPEWDGTDLLMALGNKIIANQGPSFALFDAMIDSVKRSLGAQPGGRYAFLLSSEMASITSRLFESNIRWIGKAMLYPRDDRGQLNGVISDNKNYIDGGIEVSTYRGVPFLESSFLTSLGTVGTVTPASPTGSDGVITAGTYFYAVEVLTDYGLSLAAETTQVTIGATNHVVLTWNAPAIVDANGNTRTNLLYRIHRTAANGAAGTETLYAVVAAATLSADNPAANPSFTDTGAILTPTSTYNTSSVFNAITVNSSGSQAIPDAVTPPRLSSTHNLQDIFLLPRDPDILCVPVVNEMNTVPLALVNARTQQVALEGDQVLAVRGPGFMSKAGNVYSA